MIHFPVADELVIPWYTQFDPQYINIFIRQRYHVFARDTSSVLAYIIHMTGLCVPP